MVGGIPTFILKANLARKQEKLEAPTGDLLASRTISIRFLFSTFVSVSLQETQAITSNMAENSGAMCHMINPSRGLWKNSLDFLALGLY